MKQWIKEVARGKKGSRDLSYQEAQQAAQAVVQGEATEAQLAAFLVAERLKGESPAEVLAFIEEFKQASQRIPVSTELQKNMIDFAGPYNGRKTFAATIPVSLLLAESGIPVYLHSIKSLPPKKGVALHEIMEALGISTSFSPEQIAECLEEVKIGIANTELLCPPLVQVRKVREEIGVRSFLNTAEKSLNLASASSIMVGIFHKTVLDLNVEILRQLGFNKSYIVQGAEGSEDLPIHRISFLYDVTQDEVRSLDLDPAEYGLKHRKDLEKEVLTLEEQVTLIQQILSGEKDEKLAYYRDQVVYNAGIKFYLCGKAPTIAEGISWANQQLKSGAGASQLDKWKKKLDRM
ncbi:anthranilate phosphoribosyltransferase [Caldalkalibacillus mannanilyticus]|uniref:anthranilate phosphoribosyltransferase n=1 Tax=Caldalkalibacillus mannanilyticus TaxID=1418 RepID=UPI00046AE42C|nr:glycosyl transferase [Caldalkalibacillus mannanilyticus]